MKKVLFTLLAILTAGLVGLQAQNILTVQGQITDDSTGAPVAQHHVLAVSDTALMPGSPGGGNPGGGNPGGGQGVGFLGMAFTDAQGNYSMDIDLSMVNTSQIFVITNGCQMTPQIVGLAAVAGIQTVNFTVCQGIPGGNPGGGNPGGGNPGGGNPGGGNPGGGCPGGGNPGGGHPGGGQPGMGCHAMFIGMPDTADLLTWHFHAMSMSPTATFTWDLNGTTLTGQDITTSFPAYGQYNVCLVMEDTSFNCADTFCMMIEVDSTWFPGGGFPGGGNPGGGNPGGGWPGGGTPGMGCHAMFIGMPDTADFLTWHFHAMSMSPTATFTWDVNGTTLTGQDITTIFPAYGQYNVCLVMEDTSFNCADTFCMMVAVDSTWFPGGGFPGGGNPGGGNPGGGNPGGGQPGMGCHAMFIGMPDTLDFLTWHFHAMSMSPTATFTWDLNGTTLTGQDITTSFPSYGQYNVCLVMEDTAFNCADTFCMMVEVDSTWFPGGGHPGGGHPGGGNPGGGMFNCNADFNYVVGNGGQVDFTDLSQPVPTSWIWNFGDGNSSTDQNPTHTYTVSGTYDVTLEISFANCLCTDSTAQTVIIPVSISATVGVNEITDNASVGYPYPNPATDQTRIDVDFNESGSTSLMLLDLSGKVIQSQETYVGSTMESLEINTAGLDSGIYMIMIRHENGSSFTRKLTKF